jgi:hypothetical protein
MTSCSYGRLNSFVILSFFRLEVLLMWVAAEIDNLLVLNIGIPHTI